MGFSGLQQAFDEVRFGASRTLNLRTSLPTGSEAAQRVENWLRQHQALKSGEVLVITGRGNNSEGGVSVVREASIRVFHELRRKGVITNFIEHTAGSFVVALAPMSAMLDAGKRRREQAPLRRRPRRPPSPRSARKRGNSFARSPNARSTRSACASAARSSKARCCASSARLRRRSQKARIANRAASSHRRGDERLRLSPDGPRPVRIAFSPLRFCPLFPPPPGGGRRCWRRGFFFRCGGCLARGGGGGGGPLGRWGPRLTPRPGGGRKLPRVLPAPGGKKKYEHQSPSGKIRFVCRTITHSLAHACATMSFPSQQSFHSAHRPHCPATPPAAPQPSAHWKIRRSPAPTRREHARTRRRSQPRRTSRERRRRRARATT